MKKRTRASLTVEASFVITLTILAIGVMLSLWIYKFQLCWYTQAANECLLTGSNIAVLNEEDYIIYIEQKWESVKAGNYLAPQDLTTQIVADKDEICIKVSGSTPLWGYSSLIIDIEQRAGIVKPVKYIRKAATVKEMIGQ